MNKFFIVEQSAILPSGHYFAYTRTVASAATAAGLDVTILENRRFKGDWGLKPVTAIPAFTHSWDEAEHRWIEAWGPGNLAYEIVEATRMNPPGHGDHVLVHTIGYAELRNLLNYFADLSLNDDLPFYHLLLRYDPAVLRGSIELYKPLFERIRASPRLRTHILFHTDTDQLSNAFSELTGAPFDSVPIPFMQDWLKQRLVDRTPWKDGLPITVVYLGDARLEKNYAELPAALHRLWPEFGQSRRVRFVLQSHFNTPTGEAGMLEAVQRLGQFPQLYVELILEPLSYEAYYDRLAAADAVVVPYDPSRYRLRSSGVLVEAMAAGKPVVTTAHSWMASQVNESHAVVCDDAGGIGQALETLLRDFDRYRKGAEVLAPKMLAWSSGANFIRALRDSAERAREPTPQGPRILVVMDGDATVLRNGASKVAAAQLNYLTAAGYRVCGLFLTKCRRSDTSEIEKWTDALKREIGGFGLERAFVAGSGRFSIDTRKQRALSYSCEFSIAADVAAASAFDVNLELVGFLNEHTFDAVLFNYIITFPLLEQLGLSNKPLICEIVDIQSFQKSIYGNRPIKDDDLTYEFGLLAKCSHLISLSPAETDYIKELLPEMAITTTGVFSNALPPSYKDLAGCYSIAEVISSCGPSSIEFQFEPAWQENRLSFIRRLIDLSSIDIFYISSNHKANVSGLRWFLKDVYTPYLAPIGVSMVIAGSIAEVGDWPQHDNLFIVGRIENPAPLYAASKLVVVPITEGAGMPVKTAEALAYGRPVVATSIALRGITFEPGDITVTDDPIAFASAVKNLLGSPSLRREMSARARATSLRVNNRGRYVSLMNAVFQEVLGSRSLCLSPVQFVEPPSEQFVEWDDLIRLVNRLVRAWMNEKPFEEWVLAELNQFSTGMIEDVANQVIDALLVEKCAPILRTETQVARRAALVAGSENGASVRALIKATRDCFRLGSRGAAASSCLDIVSLMKFPLEVTLLASPSVADGLTIEGKKFGPISLATNPALFRHRATPVPEARYSFGVRRIDFAQGSDKDFTLVVTQHVSLLGGKSVFGEPLISGAGGRVSLTRGGTTALRLPSLFSASDFRFFVDLVCLDAHEADIACLDLGDLVKCRRLQIGDHLIFRLELTKKKNEHSLWSRDLMITALSGVVTLLEARLHLVFGKEMGSALGIIEAFEPARGDPEVGHKEQKWSRDLVGIVEAAAKGRPIQFDAAMCLRRTLAQIGPLPDINALSVAVSDQLVQSGASRSTDSQTMGSAGATIASLLWPEALLADAMSSAPDRGTRFFFGGRGLTLQVVATFAGKKSVTGISCLLDGEPLPYADSDETGSVTWHHRADPGGGGSPLRQIEWRNEVGRDVRPMRAYLVAHFPAGRDPVTGHDFIHLTNAYGVEGFDFAQAQFWTGPGHRTHFSVPLALTAPTDLLFEISNFGGAKEPDELILILNGTVLKPVIGRDGDGGYIRARYVPPDDGGPAVASLEILVWPRHSAPDDDRSLGIAINSLQLSLALEGANQNWPRSKLPQPSRAMPSQLVPASTAAAPQRGGSPRKGRCRRAADPNGGRGFG